MEPPKKIVCSSRFFFFGETKKTNERKKKMNKLAPVEQSIARLGDAKGLIQEMLFSEEVNRMLRLNVEAVAFPAVVAIAKADETKEYVKTSDGFFKWFERQARPVRHYLLKEGYVMALLKNRLRAELLVKGGGIIPTDGKGPQVAFGWDGILRKVEAHRELLRSQKELDQWGYPCRNPELDLWNSLRMDHELCFLATLLEKSDLGHTPPSVLLEVTNDLTSTGLMLDVFEFHAAKNIFPLPSEESEGDLFLKVYDNCMFEYEREELMEQFKIIQDELKVDFGGYVPDIDEDLM